MKITLLTLGKTKSPAIKDLQQLYLNRIQHYWHCEHVEVAELKKTKNLSADQQKQLEGNALLKRIKANDFLILLDEKGKSLSSREFAAQIQKWFNQGPQHILFCVGGAYGFSPELYQRAQAKVSLSKMTFSHQFIRPIFLEQLYRAATILANDPYHTD